MPSICVSIFAKFFIFMSKIITRKVNAKISTLNRKEIKYKLKFPLFNILPKELGIEFFIRITAIIPGIIKNGSTMIPIGVKVGLKPKNFQENDIKKQDNSENVKNFPIIRKVHFPHLRL